MSAVRGNPHAAFDAAGAGNVAWSRWCDTRRRKSEPTGNTNFDLNRRASPRPYLRGAEGETPSAYSPLCRDLGRLRLCRLRHRRLRAADRRLGLLGRSEDRGATALPITGTVKRTSAPCGARGDTHKRPPWASTIDRQMASPMPRPSGFVVKKGWNMRSATAGSSPAPVSFTETSTLPGSRVSMIPSAPSCVPLPLSWLRRRS